MRTIFSVAAIILALGTVAGGAWASHRSQMRVKEIASTEGARKISATGMLNTTVSVYDENRIANAGFDFGLIEDHRDALRQLGFSAVHVQTASGEILDRPL